MTIGTKGLKVLREWNRYKGKEDITKEMKKSSNAHEEWPSWGNRVVSEIVKIGAETVFEWIWKVCKEEWQSDCVSGGWMKAILFHCIEVE